MSKTRSSTKKTTKTSKSTKSINIQKEIEKILEQEFQVMIEKNSKNPLFELVLSGKLETMQIDKIRKKVLGK